MKPFKGKDKPRTDMEVLDNFAKAKGLPAVSRVVGGGVRRVYYEDPDRVQVITGRRHPTAWAAGNFAVAAEARGMTPDVLYKEIYQEPEPQPSLPARAGRAVMDALHIG